ncbi:MAG: AI-2E family transporter [Candidatus Calescibacterium sp.]|nr:AI-2E family transporter [Candidatus Calescibacterium sp.]MDW8194691.1 AI-2E family transporter [Candidatus Calescibacterium sp.]
MYTEKLNKLAYYLLILLFIVIIYQISLFFIDIVVIYFLMLFFSIIIKPITDNIETRYKISRELSTLIIIVFVFAIVIFLILVLVSNLYLSLINIFKTLQQNLSSIFVSISSTLNTYLGFLDIKIHSDQVYQNLLKKLNENIPQIAEKIFDLAFSGGKIIFNTLLVAVLTFYMVKDYEKIRSYKIKIISKIFNTNIEEIEEVVRISETILRKFILGQLFAATYIFLFTMISLYLFKVKEYFIVALIAGIFELIPFIGAFLAFSISILFLIDKGIVNVIIFVILATIAYQILAKIIYPNVVGKILNISVITVLISIMVGLKFYGIFGMFISVPMISILKVLIDRKLNRTHS